MKKTILQSVAILICLSISTITNAQFGKGVPYMPQDSSFSMKFNLRIQSLYTAQYDDASESYATNFLVRRARLKFSGYAFNPNIQYKAEIGLTNRDISVNKEDGNGRGASRLILDAVVKWKFTQGWALWVGQTKLAGNRERVVSSADLQFVDRSLLNSKLNIDRDAGIQLRGKLKAGNSVIKPSVAITMGEGRNITEGNFGGYDYTAHIDFLPMGEFKSKGDYVGGAIKREDAPKLAFGLTFDYNDGAVRQGGQLGSFVRDSTGIYAENTLMTFFADMMFKYQGISVMSTYGMKSGDKQIDGLSKNYNTGSAFNFQLGYMFANNWELAGRFTTLRSDDEVYSALSDQNQYTLGVSRYVVGHKLKIQSDISRIIAPGEEDGQWMDVQIANGNAILNNIAIEDRDEHLS